MKNLQNFGVQELNAKEMRETDGGVIWALASAIADAASTIADAASIAYTAFWTGFNNAQK